jgi:hypothetical protein
MSSAHSIEEIKENARMRRRELLLLSASMALAACSSRANLMAPRPWRTTLIADSAPLPIAPRPVMPMTAAHSHNDYERRRPLLDALALGYRSVEADIWLRDSELWVSHKGRSFVGTLRELYLDPLQDRVDRLGSVHGDGEPFLLWLDLKSGEEEFVLELRHLLARYPMLARMDGGKMKRAAVTVILTGDENGKRAYTAGAGARYACRDSNELLGDEKRDPLHLWYSLSWTDWFFWDGEGRIPSAERNRLRALVDAAHRLGRRLRLYHLPEAEGVWSEALDAGVDLLSTDELQRLAQFLEARPLDGARAALSRTGAPSR